MTLVGIEYEHASVEYTMYPNSYQKLVQKITISVQEGQVVPSNVSANTSYARLTDQKCTHKHRTIRRYGER